MPDQTLRARVKFCGLSTSNDIKAAADLGVAYVGFVFFPKSPRDVSLETARALALDVPPGIAKVALVVDPTDAFLDALTKTVPIDMIQLHGRETPDRAAEVKARTGLPVMKAVGISGPEDVARAHSYEPVVDQLLLDAKPPKDANLPGGNGASFDWSLIADEKWDKPWMLAGGLTPDNVTQAMAASGARQLDLSSGIESAPGVKDAGRMQAFMQALQG